MSGDHHVLRDVGQLTGEITRVGRLECRIGQTLAGTVRRAEVLEHGQTFAEVGLDRRFDNLTRRLGHQTTHTAELTHLFDATAGTRVCHQEDGVHIAIGPEIVFQAGHHFGRDLFTSVRPSVEHLVVAFDFGDHTALEQLVELHNGLFGFADDLALRIGGNQIVGTERQTAQGCLTETKLVHVVEQFDRSATSDEFVTVGNHLRQFTRLQRDVVERHAARQNHIKDHAAHGGFHPGSEPLRIAAIFTQRAMLRADAPGCGHACRPCGHRRRFRLLLAKRKSCRRPCSRAHSSSGSSYPSPRPATG